MINSKKILSSVSVLSLILFLTTFTACEKVLEQITYSVTINNNSTQDVDIWLSVDGGTFEKTPAGMTAGESRTSSFYVVNLDYSYEARVGTTVISEYAFKQTVQENLIWNITD